MKPFLDISIKRLSVVNQSQVEKGAVSFDRATETIRKYMTREEAVEHLTREYDRETAEALRFFRVL